jgi:hypothetical protein
VPEITQSSTIGIEWQAPSFDGGSILIDYRIWYDNGTNGVTFTELISSYTDSLYIVSSLSEGTAY